MGVEQWGAGRMLMLLLATLLFGFFLAIGIFFRMSNEVYDLSAAAREDFAFALAGGVAGSWLLLLVSAAIPRLRLLAVALLAIAFLANMFVPSFLPTVQ